MTHTLASPRLGALAVVAVVAGAASCQIFGLTPVRCNHADADAHKACAPDEFCTADGFCAKQGAIGSCAPAPAPASRAVHIAAGGNRGVDAIGDTLFGAPAVLVADVHGCNSDAIVPGCGGQDDNPSGTQALGALDVKDPAITSTVLTEKSIRFDAPTDFDEQKGFSFEAVLKTPPRAPLIEQPGALSAIVSMASQPNGQGGAVDGFVLGVDGKDQLVLQVGGVSALLTQAQPLGAAQATNLGGIWHHVLCTVDAPPLVTGAPDAVLCAVDGKLAPPTTPIAVSGGTAAIAKTHALVVGGVEERDDVNGAAVAVVRVWAEGRPEPGLRTIDREDALLDEARARLMRYVGVQVDVDNPRFLVTNFAGFPRAEPIGIAGSVHYELVDESWPRVTASVLGARGVLLEPDRRNRLDANVISCLGASANDGAVSPDGRADGCTYPRAPGGGPTSLASSAVDAVTLQGGRGKDFAAGTAFVMSGFLRMPKDTPADGAELHFHVDGASAGGFQISSDCDLVRSLTGEPVLTGAEQKGCTVVAGFGDWVELIARMTASGEHLTATVQAHGDVWSPQLEIGVDPTTPISFDPGNTQGGGERIEDFIVLDAPGLANATSTAMRATVVSDGQTLSMSPLVVSDDAGFTDHFAVLEALGATDVKEFEPRLELTETATSVVLGADESYTQGQPVKLGADLGEPIDPCRGCADIPAVGASLPAAEQWEHVGLLGGQEAGILVNADVLTDGTEPLPLALDITASSPASGCLEGASPDIALVACAQGACPEASQVSWSGKAKLAAGPSLDERAIAGTFTTKLAAPKKLDDREIYFEVRFATSDVSGVIFSLNRADGTPFVRVRNNNGTPVIDDGHDDASKVALVDLNARGAWANADEWNQLSCWIGLQPRCVLNAAAPVDGGTPVALSGEKIASVTVGGAGASLVSFARVWLEPTTSKAQIDRLVGARVAASFGLPSQERRAAFDVVEARATPSTIAKEGQSLAVGAHWPRIIDDDGAVYLAEAGEGLTISTRDLTNFVSTTVELAFANTPTGTLLSLDTPPQTALSDQEHFALSRDAGALNVEHTFRGGNLPALALDGVEGGAFFFGARGDVMTAQGLSTRPALGLAEAPAAFTPLTIATIANNGQRIELRHVRLGTR